MKRRYILGLPVILIAFTVGGIIASALIPVWLPVVLIKRSIVEGIGKKLTEYFSQKMIKTMLGGIKRL